MSKAVETAFEKLLGDSTDKERQSLHKVKDALGLQPHDALWMVLFALERYQRLYEQVPARIEDAANASAKSAAQKAQAQINHAVAQLVPTVQEGVKNAAEQAVKQIAIKDSSIAVLFGAIGAGLLFLAGVLMGANIVMRADADIHLIAMYAGSYTLLGTFALLSWAYDFQRTSGSYTGTSLSAVTLGLMGLMLAPVLWYTAAALWAAAVGIFGLIGGLLG